VWVWAGCDLHARDSAIKHSDPESPPHTHTHARARAHTQPVPRPKSYAAACARCLGIHIRFEIKPEYMPTNFSKAFQTQV
jgi:hypothetical protein